MLYTLFLLLDIWYNYTIFYINTSYVVLSTGYSQILDEGEDFNSNNLLLTFVSGAAPDTQCITIDIVDDFDFEESESFSLSISSITTSAPPTGELATVVIQDNNGQFMLYFIYYTGIINSSLFPFRCCSGDGH